MIARDKSSFTEILGGSMSVFFVFVVLGGLAPLACGVSGGGRVPAAGAGPARMKEISSAIQEGAQAYLNRQYTTIGLVGIVLCVILGFILGLHVAIGFVIGSV